MADDELTPEQLASATKILAANEKNKTSLENQLVALREMSEIFQSIEKQIEIQNDLMDAEAQISKVLKKEAIEKLAVERQKGVVQKEVVDRLYEEISQHDQIIKSVKEQGKALDGVTAQTDSIISSFTGIGDQWKNTFVGSIIDATDKAESFASVTARIKESVKRNVTVANVLGSTMLKIQESTLAVAYAQDQATAEFSKATGTGEKYHSMITSVSEQNRVFGVTAADSAAAILDLRANMSTFTMQTATAQKEIATFSAKLSAAYGIDNYGASLETMTKGMGLSISESEDFTRQILSNAEALGINSKVAMDAYASVGPRMAAYGKQGKEVFLGLMEQAKKTGIEVQRLVNISSQFDTFEGSSKFVADFNHLLGGAFLNSMEMVNATGEERIDLIQQGMKESGKSFDQMSQHTKIAIQQQLGLESVAEAAHLLNPAMIGLTAAEKKKRIEDVKMIKQAKAAQSVFDELKNAVASLAIGIQPLVKMLSSAASWFAEVNKVSDETEGFTMNLFSGLVLLASAGWLLIKAAKARVLWTQIMAGLKTKEAVMTEAEIVQKERLSKASFRQAAAQQKMNTAAKGGWKSMLALGAAIALAGIGIAAAALGMAQFVKAFNGMPATTVLAVAVAIGIFLGGMVALVSVMAGLAPVAAGASVAFIPFGFAITLIGAGIFLAAAGMSLLVTSLVQGFDVISENLGGFLAFVGALTVFSLLSPGLAFTFGVLVPGLGAMALALAVMKTSDLQALGALFQGISNITSDTADAMMSVAESVGSIIASISKINMEKLSELNRLLEAKVAAQVAGVNPTAFAANVSAAGVQRSSAGVQSTPAAATSSSGGQSIKPVNITLKIDEREIAKISWKEIQKEMERVAGTKPRGPHLA